MTHPISLVLLVLALVCFLIRAIWTPPAPAARPDFGWLGMFFWMLAIVILLQCLGARVAVAAAVGQADVLDPGLDEPLGQGPDQPAGPPIEPAVQAQMRMAAVAQHYHFACRRSPCGCCRCARIEI